MAQQLILNVEDSKILTSLRKVLAAMKGVTIVNPSHAKSKKARLTSYEQAREDICEGRVNTYKSLDDFYKKMGI